VHFTLNGHNYSVQSGDFLLINRIFTFVHAVYVIIIIIIIIIKFNMCLLKCMIDNTRANIQRKYNTNTPIWNAKLIKQNQV
jgi:hypothetical protein